MELIIDFFLQRMFHTRDLSLKWVIYQRSKKNSHWFTFDDVFSAERVIENTVRVQIVISNTRKEDSDPDKEF